MSATNNLTKTYLKEVIENESAYVVVISRKPETQKSSQKPSVLPNVVANTVKKSEEIRITLPKLQISFDKSPDYKLNLSSSVQYVTYPQLTQIGINFAQPPSISLKANPTMPQLLALAPASLPVTVRFDDTSVVTLKVNDFVEPKLKSNTQSLQIMVSFGRPSDMRLQLKSDYFTPKLLRSNLESISVIFKEPEQTNISKINKEMPISLPAIKTTSVISTSVISTTSEASAEVNVEEINEVIDKTLFGLGNIMIERPIIISAKRMCGDNGCFDYIELLKRVLREVYRVRASGLPSPKHIGDLTDFQLLLPLDVSGGSKILVIDLTRRLGDELLTNKSLYLRFSDRLRELFSQSYGFVVIYGDKKLIGDMNSFNFQVKKTSNHSIQIPSPININISPERIKLYYIIANFMWGNIINPESFDETNNLDELVVRLEDQYWEKLKDAIKDFNVQLKVKPSGNPDENDQESMVHYLVKAFVVKYIANKLAKELKIDATKALNCIETEYKLDNITDNKILDVYVKNNCNSSLDNIDIEVETLYGTKTIVHKVFKTVEEKIDLVNKLWVVIPNPQAVIFLPTLLKLRKYLKENKKYNDKVEFFTLDITNPDNGIVELKDLAKKLLDVWKLENKNKEI
ncbi:MAG: hypothetical protein RXR31_01460 [Thermoproteota archaeon]